MIAICMTNGGMYNNVTAIGKLKTNDITTAQIEEILVSDIIEIEFQYGKAILRTACISSINLQTR